MSATSSEVLTGQSLGGHPTMEKNVEKNMENLGTPKPNG